MKKKLEFGFTSQGYEAPRAENVGIENEGLLCASGKTTTDDYTVVDGVSWGEGGGN